VLMVNVEINSPVCAVCSPSEYQSAKALSNVHCQKSSPSITSSALILWDAISAVGGVTWK